MLAWAWLVWLPGALLGDLVPLSAEQQAAILGNLNELRSVDTRLAAVADMNCLVPCLVSRLEGNLWPPQGWDAGAALAAEQAAEDCRAVRPPGRTLVYKATIDEPRSVTVGAPSRRGAEGQGTGSLLSPSWTGSWRSSTGTRRRPPTRPTQSPPASSAESATTTPRSLYRLFPGQDQGTIVSAVGLGRLDQRGLRPGRLSLFTWPG